MERLVRVAALAAVCLFPVVSSAQEIVIAVYVPSSTLASAEARSTFASSLANQLGAKLGRPARGLAFARARDLEAAIAHGEIHAAALDPIYVAAHGAGNVLGTARRGGGSEVSYIALTKLGARGIPAFRGKRVILPSVGGTEMRFLENFVLEGQVPAREFWSGVSTAPDAVSAMLAVGANQADLAIVMDSPDARAQAGQRGLQIAFTTRSVPGPALAWVRPTPDPALRAALSTAVRAVGAGPLGEGWTPAGGDYREIVAAPSLPRPIFGAPAPLPLRAPNVVAVPATDLALPAWTRILLASPARLR